MRGAYLQTIGHAGNPPSHGGVLAIPRQGEPVKFVLSKYFGVTGECNFSGEKFAPGRVNLNCRKFQYEKLQKVKNLLKKWLGVTGVTPCHSKYMEESKRVYVYPLGGYRETGVTRVTRVTATNFVDIGKIPHCGKN